jgi:hypothetical protein
MAHALISAAARELLDGGLTLPLGADTSPYLAPGGADNGTPSSARAARRSGLGLSYSRSADRSLGDTDRRPLQYYTPT